MKKTVSYIEHAKLGPNPLVVVDRQDGKVKMIRRDGYYPEVMRGQFVIPPEAIQEKALRDRKEHFPDEFLVWDER